VESPTFMVGVVQENDLGTSKEIADKHPKIDDLIKQMYWIFYKNLKPHIHKMYDDMKKIEKLSPKY